ncbi:helix-turn-helix domain-containing protein [Phytomonospora endophytica]|uniref:AraC-like DNA-binding protein n=1 Tax=Phytomonospora endophytica TaxID=714109 RepID=A0A841G2Q1_9ACTN|nr:AraC family transcriptional regulator [Phytomonospora endophytica]MBB6038410.1 AraC-like DNA-binding protein [Phytomonospora endophytica]GIG64340.1 AraC family transcriptional regulator [Phytomonospora endophytica]
MAGPRKDTRGIVDPGELMARVRFRRFEAARALRPYVENYWFIDWDLDEPYESRVVPHPSVNVVFQRMEGRGDFCVVSGIGMDLFAIKLEGVGRVCGAKFRAGLFRAFHGGHQAELTDREVPLGEVFPGTSEAVARVLGPDDERDRVAAFDAFLLGLAPASVDPVAVRVGELVDRVRLDRGLRRVDEVAAVAGTSVRGLQRLFAEYLGVSPKWAIMRYRVHEAVELAGPGTDWARLAAELGYSDQAHLVRDFRATLGVSPAAFVRASTTRG